MVDPSPAPQVALGRAIRLRREQLGLSKQDAALEAGIDQSRWSHLENGRQNPAYALVAKIARSLHWSISQLVTAADELETQDRRPLDRPLRS